jgi:hypothetical protein
MNLPAKQRNYKSDTNCTSNSTLLCYSRWNRSRYCFNTMRSMKEKRAYGSDASPNDASHPFHWGDVQGRGAGRRMAAIEGSDRNPTAIQSHFQKLRTLDNERPSASCTFSNASFRLQWPVLSTLLLSWKTTDISNESSQRTLHKNSIKRRQPLKKAILGKRLLQPAGVN